MSEASTLRNLADQRARFLSFIRRRIDSPEIAEDILQISYLRAAEHIAQLRDPTRSTAWFYRLLRNAIIDHYRRSAASAEIVSDESLDRPVESTRHPNTCPCATRELGYLNKNYARALEDVAMDGLSVHAFAANERIVPGTASVRLHRARKALAGRLQAVCGSCSGNGCFDCTCA